MNRRLGRRFSITRCNIWIFLSARIINLVWANHSFGASIESCRGRHLGTRRDALRWNHFYHQGVWHSHIAAFHGLDTPGRAIFGPASSRISPSPLSTKSTIPLGFFTTVGLQTGNVSHTIYTPSCRLYFQVRGMTQFYHFLDIFFVGSRAVWGLAFTFLHCAEKRCVSVYIHFGGLVRDMLGMGLREGWKVYRYLN